MIKKFFLWISKRDKGATAPVTVGGFFSRITPEGMCEIDPTTMDHIVIRRRLAALYKRHNHAAGSLDGEMRQEAEVMLDAIVQCREKYVDTTF